MKNFKRSTHYLGDKQDFDVSDEGSSSKISTNCNGIN